MKATSLSQAVLEHTSPHGQSSIRHDLNNASIELDMAKTEAKQKLASLDDILNKLKVRSFVNLNSHIRRLH